jgi:O-antigen/teichoic acid export membrane protein
MSLAGFVVVATLECIMSGAERVLLIVAALAAIFNIALNVIFIPIGGANAAAATTVATELFVFAVLMFQLDRKRLARHYGEAVLVAAMVGVAAAAQLEAISIGVGASAAVSIVLIAAVGRSVVIALRRLAIVSDGAKMATGVDVTSGPVPGT